MRELRGEFFSYGGASLTREVLRYFVSDPGVKLLLPSELQERQRDSTDAEARRELLQTAKHFLASVYKIRGGGQHGRGVADSASWGTRVSCVLFGMCEPFACKNRRSFACLGVVQAVFISGI